MHPSSDCDTARSDHFSSRQHMMKSSIASAPSLNATSDPNCPKIPNRRNPVIAAQSRWSGRWGGLLGLGQGSIRTAPRFPTVGILPLRPRAAGAAAGGLLGLGQGLIDARGLLLVAFLRRLTCTPPHARGPGRRAGRNAEGELEGPVGIFAATALNTKRQ